MNTAYVHTFGQLYRKVALNTSKNYQLKPFKGKLNSSMFKKYLKSKEEDAWDPKVE